MDGGGSHEFALSLKLKLSRQPVSCNKHCFPCFSGIRGLQVYRLHREVRPNYRLKCLWWLESQPQQPSWGWNEITCPCSWQQGQRDFRFWHINTGDTSFLSFTNSPTITSAHTCPSLLQAP